MLGLGAMAISIQACWARIGALVGMLAQIRASVSSTSLVCTVAVLILPSGRPPPLGTYVLCG
jgi:hypothetical protein